MLDAGSLGHGGREGQSGIENDLVLASPNGRPSRATMPMLLSIAVVQSPRAVFAGKVATSANYGGCLRLIGAGQTSSVGRRFAITAT